MLARRLIPSLLIRGHSLVKGQRFESWRSVGSAVQAVKVFESRQVDELLILDIGATPVGLGPDFALIEEMARECFTPLTVGGGVRTLDDIKGLLRAGADKVAICTQAFERPQFIREAAQKFGSQCITVAIDVVTSAFGARVVATNCGKLITGQSPTLWAKECERLGAGEILLTSVERDGTMEGYDLPLIRAVAGAVNIPVIASGGARDYNDFLAAFGAGAHAVAAGALWAFTDSTPALAKRHLASHGVRVRL